MVERDEKEHGERALLNFGHTAGHAIEKLHGFTTISHGEVVGIGMVMITKAGEENGITEKALRQGLKMCLKIQPDDGGQPFVAGYYNLYECG